MTNITQLIERWNTDEGRPYKGNLIDLKAYDADPSNIGCMCAQGQVLHIVGGYSADDLRQMRQVRADKETARIMNISVGHAILLRVINDSVDGAPSIVITNPEKVLGSEARKVLALLLHMDKMSGDDWKRVYTAWDVACDVAGAVARDAARSAARSAAWSAACDAAGAAAWAAAWSAACDAACDAAWAAANEIQGARIMRERGQSFFFLPLFGFASPDDIPSLPSDYGPKLCADAIPEDAA